MRSYQKWCQLIAALYFLFFGFLPASAQQDSDLARTSSASQIYGCQEIQDAINLLPSSGGQININSGKYYCRTAIVIGKDNVYVRGAGPGTILRLMKNANSPVVVIGDTKTPIGTRHKNIHLSDLTIDGNRANQQTECWGGPCDGIGQHNIRNNGITVRGVDDVTIENVSVHSAISGGVVTEKGCQRIKVSHVDSSDNRYDGLASYETENSLFTGLSLHDNLGAGLSLDLGFNNNDVGDSVIADNGDVGIFAIDVHNNIFHALQIRRSRHHGIFLAEGTTSANTATGNTFTGTVVSNSGWQADPTTEGFCVDSFVGGVGICLNNPSNINNLLDGSQLINNLSGCAKEASPDLLQESGVICR